LDRIQVGRISGAHGIKGWVKVFSHTEPPEQILEYSPWQLVKKGSNVTLEVKQGRQQGKRIIAQLEDLESRNDAEALLGAEIWIDQRQLAELEEGEFYWYQLEGLQVMNSAGERLGLLDHLFETGANDVMVVKPDESSIDGRERLIPYVEQQVVLEVDIEAGKIIVNWEADY